MEKKKQSALSRLMDYAGGHKYFTYASLVLAAVSAIIALVPFYEIWRMLREVLEVRPHFENAVSLNQYGWMAVGFALLAMVFYIVALICSHKAAFRVQANMRIKLMQHIMKLPLGFVESEGSGKIRKVVMESSAATETFLAHNLPDKAVSIATPIGLLVMMIAFDWRLGIASLIPAALAFILMGSFMMGPKMAEDMKQYQNALESMSSEAVEYVRGVPVLKTFGQTIFSFRRFRHAIDEYEKWTLGYTKNMMLPMVCFTTASNGIFAALIIAAYLFSGHGVTDTFILNVFFYILITSILTVTLMKVAYAGESQMLVEDALTRMDAILEMQPLPTNEVNVPKDSSVVVENIQFAYPNAKNLALDGVSMQIRSGEHIALVGPSGGGKTTLASLIARFWDVKSGTIKLGGVNVKNISSDELMNQVSYVFQDSRLLKMSILDNVRMGRPDATDEEVMQALKDAQAWEFVSAKEQGIYTKVEQGGRNLSGGQKQRLSIARALVRRPRILILDDSTSALDYATDAKLRKAIRELTYHPTTFIVSQRTSSICYADEIIVLDDGEVVGIGNHEQLMEQCPVYQEIHQSQFQDRKEA